jgi:biopolymer transport protein ExbD
MRRSIVTASEDEETEINLTPMLDVVFIMLIFFIVTASFIKEAGIDVDRPFSTEAVPKKKANMLVAISANNEIWIDRKEVDPRAVVATFERLLAETPEGSVVIQADKEAYTETVVLVMDAARKAKIERVSIAGEPTG